MLRRTLLHLSEKGWLRRWMERSAISRKLTSRFIAGSTLGDGILVLKRLLRDRTLGTLDFLGENVKSLQEAAQSRGAYIAALNEIERERLPATVSIKLTQFGLDFSEEDCRANVVALVERAAAMKSRIEIDMESSDYTDRTLAIVTYLQDRFPGLVRAVIQAYLYRSEDDIRMLSDRNIPVRLCKGAYNEPAAVAFPAKADVDANYVKLMKLLLEQGTYPAIASHDEKIIREALRHIQEQKISHERFEFQMLYGIRRDLQRELVGQDFRLRLYVPYGDAWYPYFMRRLAERPANLLFLARNLLRS
ncbi:MAG TPA: proline dehydrogenase family protein [Bryobacteraceae bacterium]|jgi:proline dehydrogenase|nr:proline dehydrogenase family protein [Bryobacteraceae bacterium]